MVVKIGIMKKNQNNITTKHTNKMVNIESNPLNGSSFMNDLRNKYMEKQTAVEYLFEQLWDAPKDKLTWYSILKKAKEMEKEQIINARIDGDENYTLVGNKRKEYAEQYYNETYK
jgi:hypothetical protein